MGRMTMTQEVKLWQILPGEQLRELTRSKLGLESRIEGWLDKDIGGFIDLLCLDRNGDVVIVELKRDKTPREVTAQALDYASWAKDLTADTIVDLGTGYLSGRGGLSEAFRRKFGTELPEVLNEQHRIIICASEIDASTARIVRYLSDTYGVGINVATFQYLQVEDSSEFLARLFLIKPSEVIHNIERKAVATKKRYLSQGELQGLADTNGVGDLHRGLVDGLRGVFERVGTTKSTLGFHAIQDGSMVVMFNLVPVDSTPDRGVAFQAYTKRIARYLGMDEDTVVGILPAASQPWQYWGSEDTEYAGQNGYFKNLLEIDHFLQSLKAVPRSKSIQNDLNALEV